MARLVLEDFELLNGASFTLHVNEAEAANYAAGILCQSTFLQILPERREGNKESGDRREGRLRVGEPAKEALSPDEVVSLKYIR
jgi:hypothetical protein